ncbi:MAG: ABC transporter permease [Candidatus Eisenbacteria bacterium]|uniref:ABC transporter permease n=1 Tax=Eiseniibacteriota bacterium TaxID=2212470 RepID=A0A956LV45_UNCEI|nr:ABC transporter permease [Candidatus Eisenbacteria bacterium]
MRAVQGQDYWELVLSQIRRRKMSMAALFVLVVLYAVAVFAPFIANDRPLYFEGVDLQAYRKAQRELIVTVESLASEVREAGSAGEGAAAATERLDLEVAAIKTRLQVMGRQLGESQRRPLDDLSDEVDMTVEKVRDRATPEAERHAGRALQLAGEIRDQMSPVADPSEVVVGKTVALTPFRTFPAFQNLGRGDVFFMVLWILILFFPLWNRFWNQRILRGHRFRIRRARRHKMLLLFGLPALCALFWQGSAGEFYVSTYKSGLTAGSVIARHVAFAPIPYGLAESNEGESFRPPTWHTTSEIDDAGYYVRGPRAGRIDRATGIPKAGQPVQVEVGEPSANSFRRHLLGTDSLGRDLATRLVWGARVSLAVGLVSTVILVLIGTIIGSIAGYYGGVTDTLISRVIEIVQTFPVFFLILITVAFVGPSIMNIMLVIGFVSWTGVARLVRGEYIRLRGQDFVVASQALGVSSARTIFRHVLPNAMGPVLVAATFSVATGILIESSLSFLGFGIKLPIPSWGSLLIESRSAEHWWIQIYPGVLIFITVMLYNLFGEGVRDALDPRLKVTH